MGCRHAAQLEGQEFEFTRVLLPLKLMLAVAIAVSFVTLLRNSVLVNFVLTDIVDSSIVATCAACPLSVG